MKIGFIVFALTFLLSFNGYVMVRGWQALPPLSPLRLLYLVVMIASFLALLSTMIYGNLMSEVVSKAVSLVGYTYLVVLVYLFLSFLLIDIVRLANHFIHFFPLGMASVRLWSMAGSLGIIGLALGVGSYEFNHPKVITLNLTTDKPLQNKELKIVAVSDLHLGISINKKNLQDYVELINAQKPDVVLLCGDLNDRSMVPLIRQNMVEEFRNIRAPLGVFAVNGNHEYYTEKPNAMAEFLKTAGITVLRDSVCLVDSNFYIVGRDDRTNTHRKDLSDLVVGLDKNLPRILMDHQPFRLEQAEQNDSDFQFSGHTHNGQIFPGNLIVRSIYELGYGYLKKGNTNYYVSSGLGLWGPQYRIGSRSELVVISLKM